MNKVEIDAVIALLKGTGNIHEAAIIQKLRDKYLELRGEWRGLQSKPYEIHIHTEKGEQS